jgi:hypothetical protein
MTDFPENPVDHIAGISLFKFIEHSQLKTQPTIIDDSITSSIDTNVTLPWYIGKSAPDTLQLSIKQKTDEQGSPYEIILEGSIADSSAAYKLFMKMRNRIFILLARDNDNITRFLGSITEPLTFTFELATSTQSGQKELRFKFLGLQITNPPIYELSIDSEASVSTSQSEII